MPLIGSSPPATGSIVEQTSYYTSGGAGFVSVSGEHGPGDSSGPWLIEKQTLSFHYNRVPNVVVDTSSGA